jgi:hypothetical protein
MMARVIADPNFQKLKPHEQKRLVKGEWRMDSQWIDLAVDSGLDRQYFLNIYKHLCGYSHSGYLSTLQIRDNWKSYEGQLEMTERITGIICSVLAHFIYVYCEFFPAAHEALQAQPDQKFIASLWRTTPEDWANYYKNRQDQ